LVLPTTLIVLVLKGNLTKQHLIEGLFRYFILFPTKNEANKIQNIKIKLF